MKERIAVTFLPWYENPYQAHLAAELDPLGVKVTAMSAREFVSPAVAWRTKPDILHLHWLQQFVIARNIAKSCFKFFVFIVHLLIVKSRGVKIVWTAHDLGDHEKQNPFLDRLVTKWVARLSHGVIAHCDAAKQLVVEQLGLKNPDVVHVVPLGNYLDSYSNDIGRDEARRKLGIPDDRFVLLFIGVLKPYKGVEELIETLERFASDKLYLIVAGLPHREDYGELIRSKIGDRKNIRYDPGYMPDEQVQVYMNACDVTVFPFRNVLSSSSILLSMTFGRPCIAPRMGCIPESLDEAGSFLYDPAAETGLHDAIQTSVKQRDELAAMGKRCRKFAAEASWDRIAQKTLAVYQTITPTRG